jgi:ATP-dependent Clp protease ATP-binding subunit ClpA
MTDRDKFNKFTQRARKVLSLAQEEAQRFQHNYIGTEHILLGLIREGEGVGAKVLRNLGVDLQRAHDSVEFIIGRGDRIVLGEIGLTPRAKKVIEYAVDEARRLNHHYIGTEHLLLGLLREGEGIAAGVLQSLGVNLEQARRQTLAALGGGGQGGVQEPRPEEAEGSEIPDQGKDRAINLEPLQDGDDRPLEATPGQTGRFDKFSVRARRVMESAQQEAQRFQHSYIGTEHILLGLVRENKGIATHVLLNLGVERDKVRSTVEYIVGRGDRIVVGEIGLIPRAKRVIELAVDEARRMNHSYIGTEHLLLGLVREGEGIAAEVLDGLGVTLEKARKQTVRLLGHE